jgi:hypothetical protein
MVPLPDKKISIYAASAAWNASIKFPVFIKRFNADKDG